MLCSNVDWASWNIPTSTFINQFYGINFTAIVMGLFSSKRIVNRKTERKTRSMISRFFRSSAAWAHCNGCVWSSVRGSYIINRRNYWFMKYFISFRCHSFRVCRKKNKQIIRFVCTFCLRIRLFGLNAIRCAMAAVTKSDLFPELPTMRWRMNMLFIETIDRIWWRIIENINLAAHWMPMQCNVVRIYPKDTEWGWSFQVDDVWCRHSKYLINFNQFASVILA